MTSISRLMALLSAAIVSTGCSNLVPGTGGPSMSDEEIEAKDDGVCRSFGLQPGTTAYADCRLKQRMDRRLKQRTDRSFEDTIRRWG